MNSRVPPGDASTAGGASLGPDLSALLARVEAAEADDQWGLIREAGKLLITLDPWRAQLNALCDAGGFTDAALSLCERVLPGWRNIIDSDGTDGTGNGRYLGRPRACVFTDQFNPDAPYHSATAPTPALALLAAMLKALIAGAPA